MRIENYSEYTTNKIYYILISYIVIILSYPYIKYNNNYLPGDFVHFIPQLSSVVGDNFVITNNFALQGSGNTVFYQVIVLTISQVTNLTASSIYLYAIPFSAGIFLIIVLSYFIRDVVKSQFWLIGFAIVITSPLIIQIASMGKHSPFTYSLFFLILSTVWKTGKKYRLIVILLSGSIIMYHIYIAGLLAILLVGIYLARELLNSSNSVGYAKISILMLSISWVYYFITTPWKPIERVFNRILTAIFVSAKPSQSETAAPSGTGSSWLKYINILASRWEVWWVYFFLNFWHYLVMISAGIFWTINTAQNIRQRNFDDYIYICSTILGIFGLFVVYLNISGYSKPNLVFRYIMYFLPICSAFLVSRDKFQILLKRNPVTILFLIFFIFSIIVSPIAHAPGPSLLSEESPKWSYSDTDGNAVIFLYEYSVNGFSVPDTPQAKGIIYIELEDYRSAEDLGIQNRESNLDMRRENSQDIDYTHIVYSNNKSRIIYTDIKNGTV